MERRLVMQFAEIRKEVNFRVSTGAGELVEDFETEILRLGWTLIECGVRDTKLAEAIARAFIADAIGQAKGGKHV
jgi:hypothetical protein